MTVAKREGTARRALKDLCNATAPRAIDQSLPAESYYLSDPQATTMNRYHIAPVLLPGLERNGN